MKNKISNFYKNTKLIYILILGGIVGILVPALVTGLILFDKNHNLKLTNLKSFGQSTLINLSSALRGHLWDLREDLANELIETIMLNRDIKSITVIDTSSNKIFASSVKPALEGENLFTFTKPIIHNQKTIGTLQLVITDYYVYEDIYALSKQFIYIFAGQLIVSFIIFFGMLFYKILQPLNRLNQQAVFFAKEDFSKKFIWQREDELGVVGRNFDAARDELLKAQQFSQNYKIKLQEEVDKKTKELKELNETLEQRVFEELEKNKKQNILLQQQTRLAALGEMMGNIAHQWRQPLSAITTRASALQLQEELGILKDNDIKETTDGILKSATFLSQTIEDFRDFLRTDKIKKEFIVEKVIYDIYNIIKASYEVSSITIHFNIEKNLSYVGFPSELSQVILNILNNARDALVSNNIEQKFVSIDVIKNEKEILITIYDNAGGIPESIINKIFDPYFTTKDQQQGTGIGLYMSMQIIQDNFNGNLYVKNEEIEFESLQYTGAKFYIQLPL